MTDSKYRPLLQFAGPGSDGFVVSNDKVISFEVELLYITEELPVAIGRDCLSISEATGLCHKGQARAVLEIPKGLHIEKAISGSAREKPGHLNIRVAL